MRKLFWSTVLVIGTLVMVDETQAQACWGIPSRDGQVALGVGAGFASGVTSYQGSVGVDFSGPVSVGGSVGIVQVDDVDDNVTSVSGSLGFELPASSLSICPTIGIGYSTFGTTITDGFDVVDLDASGIQLPITLDVGKRFDTQDGLVLVPSAYAGILHSRSSAEAAGYKFKDDSNEFVGGARLALGWQQFVFGGGVSFTTAEGSDPVFSLTLGVIVP